MQVFATRRAKQVIDSSFCTREHEVNERTIIPEEHSQRDRFLAHSFLQARCPDCDATDVRTSWRKSFALNVRFEDLQPKNALKVILMI